MIEKKILVVDDDDDIRRLLEKRLAEEGYYVISAATGKQAVEQSKLYRPNLILLDIMLPDLDGAEVVGLLKEEKITENIPIIVLSGIASREEDGTQSTVNIGSRRYPSFSKPFSFEDLSSEVKKVLK